MTESMTKPAVFEFVVPGKAEPQGSKTKTRWGVREDNPRTMPWRGRISLVAHDYMVAHMNRMLTDIPVKVVLEFVMPRPKSAPKTFTPAMTKAPDIDKLSRAVLDGITHICIHNDSQVTRLEADKRLAEIGEEAHVKIRVEERDVPSRRPGHPGSPATAG